MKSNPVTHPPLSSNEIDAIASMHRSAAALSLLEEVERLRSLECVAMDLVGIIRAGRVDPSTLEPYLLGLVERHEGRMPSFGRFGRGKKD